MSIGVGITLVNEIHHSTANYVDSVVGVCTIETLSIEVKVKVIRDVKVTCTEHSVVGEVRVRITVVVIRECGRSNRYGLV